MRLSRNKYFAQIGYKPHAAQRLYHDSQARFRLAACGRRFGKTLMVARDLEPELLTAPESSYSIYWIVGPSYSLAEKEFRVIWDDLMVGQQLLRDKRIKRAYDPRQGNMFIEFPWKVRLEVKSAAKKEQLVGESLTRVIMSEAAKHDSETWERYVRPALADKRGKADMVSTPEGYNWWYSLWQEGTRDTTGVYESWRFPSWLNTVVFPGGREDPEIVLAERTSTKEWFDQEYGAEFSSFLGKIYAEFDESKHVKRHEFRPEWPNYIGMDWGTANPFAAIEFQVSPQDEIFIWRQYYRTWETLLESIEQMKGREQPPGYHIDLCFGDSADPDAIMTVNQHFAPCVGNPEAKKNWRQGVNLVKNFLKDRPTGQYDDFERPVMAPMLYVDPSCPDVIREFNNYRTKDNPEAGTEHNAKGVAKKQDDHSLDAIRYSLMHLFVLGVKPGQLSDVVIDHAENRTLTQQNLDRSDRLTLVTEDDLSSDSFFDMEMSF